MGRNIDITYDVNVDVEGHRSTYLTAGSPPEEEGEYFGVLYFDEIDPDEYAGGEYLLIPGPQGPAGTPGTVIPNAYHLLLGGAASNGDGDFSDGQINLSEDMSVTEAIDLLNEALKAVSESAGSDIPNGFHLILGGVTTHGDGDFDDGAVSLTPEMPVSEAVDRINEILGRLVPTAPPDFPNSISLTVSNSAGSSPRLASGATDNASSSLSAGDAVTRIVASGVSSNTFGDVGPGESGTVSALLNGTVIGQRTLTGSGDAGSYNGLVISDQNDYPVETPGFYKSIDIALNGLAASVGINKAQITHSGAGSTNEVFFVRDDLNTAPAVTSGSVAQAAAGTLAYSSGVPHYGTGAQLTVGCSISNLAGQTYYGGSDPLVISGTNSIISSDTKTYAQLGISTPIAASTTSATAISAQTVDIDGSNVHNVGVIRAVARNVAGSSAATNLSSTNILVKRGSAGARIDEASITVSGLGSSPNTDNALRKGLGSGDTPSGAPAAWDATVEVATHEAVVSAGTLKHDQTDYSEGYLPVGPDYSTGRSGAQYATFSFRRAARSSFRINVTGSYAGCWVRLPGVSDDQPNSPNGWWDAFQPYDGAGVPGETGDLSNGCALGTVMSGASGTFTITFGTESSTNADDNEILVRFRLNAGQEITALSFTN